MLIPIPSREAEELALIQKEVDALSLKQKKAKIRALRGSGRIGLKDSLIMLMITANKSAIEARNMIVSALQSGDISATGTINGQRTEIPKELFQDRRH